jgi:hypothetical protein
MLRILLPIALLAFCAPVFAQAPSDAPKPKAERRIDCSKAKDPKACEERLARAKKARQACEGKKGTEGRDCMRREYCAQEQDPAKCEARVKERAAHAKEQRAKIREACKDKTGDELKSCVRAQSQKK